MTYREYPPKRNILPNENRMIEEAQARQRIRYEMDHPTQKRETGRPVRKGVLALVSALLHLGRF